MNNEEAEAVVQAIRHFTVNYPELSLGVVTMNSKQRDLIEQKIDDLEDASLVKYRTDWDKKHESFFVKNLENVQGDERDVIFISFGWGRTKEGAFHQRFNLVNRADGHRRLNVLFTRAKRKIVIFTGLEPKNIIYEEGRSARGVRVLREYLEYAESIDRRTRSDNDNGSGPADFDPGDPDSPFEQSVGEALRASGYRFRYQVGAAGYRIDIGILYPESDNSYAVGIECDGATYHRAASTRDRDRLRQEALERLGWKILRIWSTDWFRDWRGQINRLKIEIDAALVMLADSAPGRLVTTDFATETSSPGSLTEMDSSVAGDQEAIHPIASDDEIAIDKPPSPREADTSIADRLRQFRETTIMVDFPGSEPQRCILREEMISQFIAKLVVDPADFTARIPEHLRTRTDGRQVRYLERICEIISQPRGETG
ncbi:AAA domain-containing protein [Acidiphilium acidophilum]|uniref:AAA domain-containing protein n=1 Tax=Acidiphilium acidophilum TaxID=76588 RepID=UPI002E8E66CC|nr:AAA domain-containing protein [Acidiphilium acidophilum]